jgi:GT2 family glycosyltransferase
MTDTEEAPFDEETYLRFNPDVRAALAGGLFASGRDHYERYGKAEGRHFKKLAPTARDRVVAIGNIDSPRPRPRNWACSLDQVVISRSGGIFIAGWVNDYLEVLDSIDLYLGEWAISFDGAGLARQRRGDVEAARELPARHPYGFWGFIFAGRKLPGGPCSAVIRLKTGAEASLLVGAEVVEDDELRSIALMHMERAGYFGQKIFEATSAIAGGNGAQLVAFNKAITKRAVAAPYAERFGAADRAYKGSLIVCLYGRTEFMFLQHALFSKQTAMADYEFIYVCNSPELAEPLLNEARQCSLTYGLDQSVIILGANAGFGAANNLAAEYANSSRLLLTNPDVFPREADFLARHSALMESAPAEQTALFGAPLYYDDGSLMHGGMYFEMDTLPRFPGGTMEELSLLRVEHYGKGAPPETTVFLRPRRVPAVSGAFMSLQRGWFEKLGGFSTDYVLGHYEDADLCLKSLAKGQPAWIHNIKLWHMEGKGSAGMAPQNASQTINRWMFTKNWGEMVQQNLLGPAPAHPGLA